MTHRVDPIESARAASILVAAMYPDGPPPGASQEVLGEWIRQQVDAGRDEHAVAQAARLDVATVRRILGERST